MGLAHIIRRGFNRFTEEKLILDSGLFDPDWYASQHTINGGPEKALEHFLSSNGKFDASPRFSCHAYLSDNSDVQKSQLNPLLHYLRFGKEEGRVFKNLQGQIAGPVEEFDRESLAHLHRLFDPAFYRETNPDLKPDTDGFEHFLRIGWRQQRDPAAWFSLEGYGIDHGTLLGKNPFAHYVFYGAINGLHVRPSRRVRLARNPCAPSKPRCLAAVAMVKNEADIIELFASHALALFDAIVIVDHQSSDGTEAFLAELDRRFTQVQVLTLREPSYIQSVTMTHVLRNSSKLRRADWVFFLDADEFLPFQNRAELCDALHPYASCPVISFQWKNIIPLEYSTDTSGEYSAKSYLSPPLPSQIRKIAIQPSKLAIDRVVVAQGNHAILETLNGFAFDAAEAHFNILHIPVRSIDQMRLKLSQGVQSYKMMSSNRDAKQGKHWADMHGALTHQAPQDALLNAMAVNYSDDAKSLKPIEKDELFSLGFKQGLLTVASRPTGVAVPRRPDFERSSVLYRGDNTSGFKVTTGAVTHLLSRSNGDLVAATPREAEYPKLLAPRKPMVDQEANLASFVSATKRELKTLLPSDWAGHVPFLLALTSLIKPRRYVELGYSHGTSFLAFLQAAQTAGLQSEAIAVSPLKAADDLEEETLKAFNSFRFAASWFRDRSGFLLMDQTQAADRFEANSIDLINVNASRYASNLDEVLLLWKPKLTRQGVVLLHGIGAKTSNSQLGETWDRLRNQNPSLEFSHDGGLGLVCYGSDVCSALLRMSQTLASNRHRYAVFQRATADQASAFKEMHVKQHALEQMELRLAVCAVASAHVKQARKELAAAKARLDAVRVSMQDEVAKAALT